MTSSYSFCSFFLLTTSLLLLWIALVEELHIFVDASFSSSDSSSSSSSSIGTSSSCNLIASVDEVTEQIEYKCEHDDLVYSIENYSSEFDELLLHPERLFSGIQLDIQGAYISDDGRNFVIPSDADVGFPRTATAFSAPGTNGGAGDRAGRHRHRHRQLYRNEFGNNTVLVVYVRDANGDKPDKNPSGFVNSIEDDVFGTKGDSLNLANVVRTARVLYFCLVAVNNCTTCCL